MEAIPGAPEPRHVFSAEEPLPITGERTTPGVPEENYWFQRHVAAYRFAAERVRGLRVLDAGCGEGYGCDLLARTAALVVGADLDEALIRRARRRYPVARFEPVNLVALPHSDGAFDAVVSLQVIEHLHEPWEFLRECARVLRPGGSLILSTPNRLTFSPEGLRNPFHTFEYAPDELAKLLGASFARVDVGGTFHGARLRALEAVLRRSFPERLISQPVPEWPGWLRAAVARVTPGDFRIRRAGVASSLDLVAVARR